MTSDPKHLPTSDDEEIRIKDVTISPRSRLFVKLMRWFLRPWLRWVIGGSYRRIARMQLRLAAQVCRDSSGLPFEYAVIGPPGNAVPGHVVGDLSETHRPVLLYLHGGAFVMPAVPATHGTFLSRMCRSLDAVGVMPDYRLGPFNRFPAALDDCEAAYRALLDLGFDPTRVLLAGESAGGNLVLGLLQRIRKAGLPMPACAVPISPVTEMGRIHAPPSRAVKMGQDPILPIDGLHRIDELYGGGHNAADPELSPLYMDCTGLPPLYLLASDAEVLLDDTVLLTRRARAAGVRAKIDVWPVLPHAFPLFAALFPEVRQAREDIVAFMAEHLPRS